MKSVNNSSNNVIIILSPLTLKGPFILTALIPSGLIFPATITENILLKLPANSCLGSFAGSLGNLLPR